ncbi:MAG TPA: DUF4159 domain-containing protein [bacterium]|nr:DUF4159 domain-containing protein [bacterium]
MKIALLVMAGLVFAQAAGAQTPETLVPPPSGPPARPLNIRPGDTQAKPKNLGGSVVRLGRLHYGGGGDWYANPTSLPNLARELSSRLGMEVEIEEGRAQPLDDDLFELPILHMTGHGNVRFTPEEGERLRWYLVHGGFLFADDNYGMDDSFRREMRKIFPEDELVELPFDHEIYHTVYAMPHGLPKIHEHHGGPPHGYGIFHEGRMVVFYSYNTDIGDGLEDPEVHGDPAEVREEAMKMAINVIAYAMTH